ncbi:MAG: gliding motility protein GldD, partial [Segetibacter sp.]|nr:gliding motility protein GldD [Segetibacter sp.]
TMKKNQTLLILLLIIVFFIAQSCNSDYTPKPKGYFKIELPKKEYRSFNQPGYPYSFEYPMYANVVKDSSFFGEATENPWWINLDFPQFNGKVHVSYKEVGPTQFDKLVKDAFSMTNKHNLKAYSIDDSLIQTPNNIHGMFFKVGGNVATANQFFLTDTTKHFLRGALYFDATPNEDSLGIVNRFLMEDVKHMINTFRWK